MSAGKKQGRNWHVLFDEGEKLELLAKIFTLAAQLIDFSLNQNVDRLYKELSSRECIWIALRLPKILILLRTNEIFRIMV